VEAESPQESLDTFSKDIMQHLGTEWDTKARARLGSVMAQLFHAYTSTGEHYHAGGVCQAKEQDSWLPGFQGVSVERKQPSDELRFNFEQFIVHYVVSFFYVMYYVLSNDAEFPEDSEVKAALEVPETPTSKTTLAQCAGRFWLLPAANLRGILPGVLNVWDAAYAKRMPSNEDTRMCDAENEKWMKCYLAYAGDVVEGYSTLATTATYATVPPRAIARLQYFMFGMVDFHAATPFPTCTAIQDLVGVFKECVWAGAEV
jgi:hypothetical protein